LTETRSFQITARLGLTTTALLFGLMILGSVVRTTGSGLACPDWPLCGGHLIPPFEPHVMIEWTHRLVALLTSVSVMLTLGWIVTHAGPRARLGGLAVLALVLLAVQILLGALTVWKLLSPAVVSSHLAVALLLLGTLLALTMAARTGAESPARAARRRTAFRAQGSRTIAVTTVAAYGQCLLGGIVSATHAGAVCRDWPTCNGVWFPPLQGLTGLHMLHRYGAYTLAALVVFAALRARHATDPAIRASLRTAFGLVLLQVALGVGSVMMGVPPWLSALHLATAVTLVSALWVGTLRTYRAPVRALRPAASEAA
jgi:heme A synthase